MLVATDAATVRKHIRHMLNAWYLSRLWRQCAQNHVYEHI